MVKKDIISQSLGIEPQAEPSGKIVNIIPAVKAERGDDYEYARRNNYDIIEKGMSALEDIIDIAKQSESARAFEVATNLMKTMLDANKDLLDLAQKNKELTREDKVADKLVTNNNLFVGSSAELLKMLKGNKSEND
jgi:hypothetical protein